MVLQVFDPIDSQYRPATPEEIAEAAGPPPDEAVDPAPTGPDPIAPTIAPEDPILSKEYLESDPETGDLILTTDPETGQQSYTLLSDIVGGSIDDPRIGVPGVNPDVTFEDLDFRRTARGRGFVGDLTDERAREFVGDERGRRGLVDEYGFTTAAGRVEDILKSPTADMPEGALYDAALIDPTAPGTVIDPMDRNQYIQALPSVIQTGALATDTQDVTERAAAQFEAQQQFDQVSQQQAQAALLNDQIQLITAQEEEANDLSTVRGQLTRLSNDFEGGQVPPWAEGAVAAATQIMAARGISSSGIAQSAITSALMNTMIPIAQADANINAEFQRLNLNNRQQAQVQNAANLLTSDIKDIDNTQQVALFNTGNRVQSLFNDQSEVNAARRINSASVNQTQQFFSGLQQQVLNTNAAQKTAISQFNAGQANALEQFRATQALNASEFNARNYTAIKQANTQWFRQVNTANTAAINAENQFNATNILNRSNTALNNQLQLYRDKADFIFNASQNDAQRQNNLAIATLQAEATLSAAKEGSGGGSFFSAAGGILGSIFGSFAGSESGAKAIKNAIPFLSI